MQREVSSDRLGSEREAPAYSVVIPCYNSTETIGELVTLLGQVFRRLRASYEIVAVDDASPDTRTWSTIIAIAKTDPVRAIQFTRNFGRTAAVLCGMQHARGRWIIVMDDDLQHRPEDIEKLVAMKSHDAVVADFPYNERQHTFSQRLSSRLRNRFDSAVLGKPSHIRMSPFILIRADIAKMMLLSKHQHAYIPALLLNVTRDIVAVRASHAARKKGRSNFGFFKRLKLFSNLVFNNSSILLKGVAAMGASLSALALFTGCYLIARRLLSTHYAPGWTSIAVMELFIGGAILLSLGIIGEYLVRIIQLGEQRPTYFVRASFEQDDRFGGNKFVVENGAPSNDVR